MLDRVRIRMFYVTSSNISIILWLSVLLLEESRVPGENIDLSQVSDKRYHIMLHRVHLAWVRFELTTLVVISTDCITSYKSNNHAIMTKTTPLLEAKV